VFGSGYWFLSRHYPKTAILKVLGAFQAGNGISSIRFAPKQSRFTVLLKRFAAK
jgi:hypothetical protein